VSIRGESQRTMLFCIDSCESGVPKGKIFTAANPDGRNFACLFDMLNIAQHDLDDMNFPQSFSEIRKFVPGKGCISEDTEANRVKCGELATFTVKVLFRQNASWQGSVSWIEGGVEESFRSVLELIFLMNSAVESVNIKA